MENTRPLRVGDVVQIVGAHPEACMFVRQCVGMQGTVCRIKHEDELMHSVDVGGVKCGYCSKEPYYERRYLKLIGNRPDLSSMDTLRDLGLFNDEWIKEHANA
jgi:hypothetical protein